MDENAEEIQKWGFGLQELYRLAMTFYKQNSGKAIHLSYEDNLKLIAFKQQASLGPFDPRHAPELGVLDVIGKDRRLYWQTLGPMSRVQAKEGFIDFLDTMCSSFRPYVEAVRKNRDEILKTDLKCMEAEKLLREQQKSKSKETLEEGYKQETQRRQLQDALNKQTYQQFKNYAEKQFPGVPEQQAVLIHQLQQEHYHQYMQQFIYQNSQAAKTAHKNDGEAAGNDEISTTSNLANDDMSNVNDSDNEQAGGQAANQERQQIRRIEESHEDDYPLIHPAKIWTRPDIQLFKTEVSAGDGDGVLTISHGDTVTVRVPTSTHGKCIFWEFATDSYDIGFGIYFEWSKPISSDVTVIVSDTEDEEFYEDDYVPPADDLESGAGKKDNKSVATNIVFAPKPPISIIVPIYRRECYNEVYVGSHTYPGEGVYLLKFDNSYSIWRSKTLYYRVYYER